MRLKKLSLMLALTLLVSVSALPVTVMPGGSKDTTPPTLTASLEGDALKIESSDDLSGVERSLLMKTVSTPSPMGKRRLH